MYHESAWIVLRKSSVSLWICCRKKRREKIRASQKRIKMGKLYMHEDERKSRTHTGAHVCARSLDRVGLLN